MAILITGATGAFGQAFVRRLLSISYPYCEEWHSRIAILSRGEFRQFEMARELKELDKDNRLRFFIGDVRDKERLKRAMDGIDTVVHAAALKRIEVGHYNPLEMVKTNVFGSTNVIEASQDAGVERVVFLSSDKAFQPVSPYGTSKAIAENLFLASNNTTGGKTRFSCTRYGNVAGSTGSVVPVWLKMKRAGVTTVPVTDPDCTRFFMKMHEAVDLVLKALNLMPTTPLIPILPAYRLGDLAEAMGLKMEVLGLPPWEKLHEGMAADNTSDKARRMSVAEIKHELGKLYEDL